MRIPLTEKIPKVPEGLSYDWVAEDREWELLEMTVTPEDAARWRRIFESDDPWEIGPSPFGGSIAPHSILYYPGQASFAPRRDFNAVLASIGYQAHGPIHVGHDLTATTTITERSHRRGRAFVNWELDVRDDGKPVCNYWRTWAFPAPEGVQLPERQVGGESLPSGELEVLPPLSLHLSLDRMRDFEGPGEHNGHTDPEMNRRSGAPGALAQGALSFGLLCRLLRDQFGERWITNGRIDVRLTRPVYHDDTVTAHAAIVDEHEGRLRCRVWVTNSDRDTTVAGIASVPA
jgi:acyl dehydratase